MAASERRRPAAAHGAPRDKAAPAQGKRQQNNARIRHALFDAAARVVGEFGYAEASIARITEAAGVAQGTFYNYFASRQDLLNQLLPKLGEEMLAYIAAEVQGISGEVEREERRFAAFFGFLEQRPAFFRILNEAELFAPQGFRQHFENIAESYLAALRHAHARGGLPGFAEEELEPLVFLLMAMRSYTSMRYAYTDGGQARRPPDALWRAYAKLLRHGLSGAAPGPKKRQER
ncbi:TetR/AcrR family transcriptional regulator [Teichococcus wenyumeiae]|uniref:TetR/AcrR family transcriptional regulator n=1 Tax=Teichococcus wenyumeiae TaxID=2478470 RepID=UPI00131502B1|nr:TetR/AcrR family transcriptional regulator [Pseudoroseomonas wenyumeiae]